MKSSSHSSLPFSEVDLDDLYEAAMASFVPGLVSRTECKLQWKRVVKGVQYLASVCTEFWKAIPDGDVNLHWKKSSPYQLTLGLIGKDMLEAEKMRLEDQAEYAFYVRDLRLAGITSNFWNTIIDELKKFPKNG